LTYGFNAGALLTQGGWVSFSCLLAGHFLMLVHTTYDAAQHVTAMTLGSGTTEAYNYINVRMQLMEQKATNGSITLMDLTYNYSSTPGASGSGSMQGNSGQLMAISSGSKIYGQPRDETFGYDNVGGLVTASGWAEWGRQYKYDRWGNRTQTLDTLNGNAVLQNFTLNQQPGSNPPAPNNQVATETKNNLTYHYDASGNMTSDGAHTYGYDAEGRLATVDALTPNEFDYSYDVNNWRVKKVPGTSNTTGATTYYVWNAGQVIAEYSNAAPTATSNVMYYHPDRLSMRLVTDGSGTVVGTEDVIPSAKTLVVLRWAQAPPALATDIASPITNATVKAVRTMR
jgi:hypothetical protein